jgi:catechol 2,3-dioxygenase-like lactoylglutathione lyase family enzyme
VGEDAADGAAGFREINAVTLSVADMDRSVAFYTDLGFPVVVGGAGAPFTTVRAGRSFLNLQLVPDWAPANGAGAADVWGRVIFWVDDVDSVHERALVHGHPAEFPPTDAPWGERYFHLRDPDGHELSFARPLDD